MLHETMGALQITGLVLVCSGLLMLKFKPNANKTDRVVPLVAEEINPSVKENITIYVIIAFISCLMNSISGFMDKILMKDITSSQLQFWYMLFIVFYYAVYILIKKEKISLSVIKNPWVWILAVLFVTGDKALFIANADPDSKISVMTLIKQSACIVTILGGKFIFKEKGIAWKLLCASVIISGIVLGVLK